jgi:hypothetical protein
LTLILDPDPQSPSHHSVSVKDRHLLMQNFQPSKEANVKERCPELRSLAGVFDGHKRAEPAETAAKRLPELLARSGLCHFSCASLRGYLLPIIYYLPLRMMVAIYKGLRSASLAGVFSSHKGAKPADTCQSPWPGTGLYHQRMDSNTGHAVTVFLGGRPAGACSQNTSAADGFPVWNKRELPKHT